MLALVDAHVVPVMRSVEAVEARGQVEALREQVLRLVAQLRRSRHPQLVEPELERAEHEFEAAESRLADLEEREAARGGHPRSLAEILDQGTEGERRAVVAAYLDRVVLRRGSEPLSGRVLLLLRGEESAFGPLPGRGRKVAMRPWPEFPPKAPGLPGTREQAR